MTGILLLTMLAAGRGAPVRAKPPELNLGEESQDLIDQGRREIITVSQMDSKAKADGNYPRKE
jgi:hypothetical protein